METRNFNFHDSKSGAAIRVRVIPRSSQNEIAEILTDGVIKIRLKASPIDGKANQLLIEFLSKLLKIRKNQIGIIAGQTKKDKLITILDVNASDVQIKLTEACRKASSIK